MPQGDKSKYAGTRVCKTDQIAQHYQACAVPEREAKCWAWTTVNKDGGGGRKSCRPGRGSQTAHSVAHQGDEAGGESTGLARRVGAHDRRREIGSHTRASSINQSGAAT